MEKWLLLGIVLTTCLSWWQPVCGAPRPSLSAPPSGARSWLQEPQGGHRRVLLQDETHRRPGRQRRTPLEVKYGGWKPILPGSPFFFGQEKGNSPEQVASLPSALDIHQATRHNLENDFGVDDSIPSFPGLQQQHTILNTIQQHQQREFNHAPSEPPNHHHHQLQQIELQHHQSEEHDKEIRLPGSEHSQQSQEIHLQHHQPQDLLHLQQHQQQEIHLQQQHHQPQELHLQQQQQHHNHGGGEALPQHQAQIQLQNLKGEGTEIDLHHHHQQQQQDIHLQPLLQQQQLQINIGELFQGGGGGEDHHIPAETHEGHGDHEGVGGKDLLHSPVPNKDIFSYYPPPTTPTPYQESFGTKPVYMDNAPHSGGHPGGHHGDEEEHHDGGGGVFPSLGVGHEGGKSLQVIQLGLGSHGGGHPLKSEGSFGGPILSVGPGGEGPGAFLEGLKSAGSAGFQTGHGFGHDFGGGRGIHLGGGGGGGGIHLGGGGGGGIHLGGGGGGIHIGGGGGEGIHHLGGGGIHHLGGGGVHLGGGEGVHLGGDQSQGKLPEFGGGGTGLGEHSIRDEYVRPHHDGGSSFGGEGGGQQQHVTFVGDGGYKAPFPQQQQHFINLDEKHKEQHHDAKEPNLLGGGFNLNIHQLQPQHLEHLQPIKEAQHQVPTVFQGLGEHGDGHHQIHPGGNTALPGHPFEGQHQHLQEEQHGGSQEQGFPGHPQGQHIQQQFPENHQHGQTEDLHHRPEIQHELHRPSLSQHPFGIPGHRPEHETQQQQHQFNFHKVPEPQQQFDLYPGPEPPKQHFEIQHLRPAHEPQAQQHHFDVQPQSHHRPESQQQQQLHLNIDVQQEHHHRPEQEVQHFKQEQNHRPRHEPQQLHFNIQEQQHRPEKEPEKQHSYEIPNLPQHRPEHQQHGFEIQQELHRRPEHQKPPVHGSFEIQQDPHHRPAYGQQHLQHNLDIQQEQHQRPGQESQKEPHFDVQQKHHHHRPGMEARPQQQLSFEIHQAPQEPQEQHHFEGQGHGVQKPQFEGDHLQPQHGRHPERPHFDLLHSQGFQGPRGPPVQHQGPSQHQVAHEKDMDVVRFPGPNYGHTSQQRPGPGYQGLSVVSEQPGKEFDFLQSIEQHSPGGSYPSHHNQHDGGKESVRYPDQSPAPHHGSQGYSHQDLGATYQHQERPEPQGHGSFQQERPSFDDIKHQEPPPPPPQSAHSASYHLQGPQSPEQSQIPPYQQEKYPEPLNPQQSHYQHQQQSQAGKPDYPEAFHSQEDYHHQPHGGTNEILQVTQPPLSPPPPVEHYQPHGPSVQEFTQHASSPHPHQALQDNHQVHQGESQDHGVRVVEVKPGDQQGYQAPGSAISQSYNYPPVPVKEASNRYPEEVHQDSAQHLDNQKDGPQTVFLPPPLVNHFPPPRAQPQPVYQAPVTPESVNEPPPVPPPAKYGLVQDHTPHYGATGSADIPAYEQLPTPGVITEKAKLTADGKPVDPNDPAQVYHAYYAPADHSPPPGYVRLSVKEFNKLFKDADIQYVGSESQNKETKTKNELADDDKKTVLLTGDSINETVSEDGPVLTLDLKPGQTIEEALSELGTINVEGIRIDASQLQEGRDFEIVDVSPVGDNSTLTPSTQRETSSTPRLTPGSKRVTSYRAAATTPSATSSLPPKQRSTSVTTLKPRLTTKRSLKIKDEAEGPVFGERIRSE